MIQIYKLKLKIMKALNWIGWISGGIGAIIILLAVISLVTGKNIFGFGHVVNYFQAANSFLLMAIALFIVVYRCDCKK
jgi:ABC-type nickel/cobalt efflux system permease component RcnA